MEAEYGATHLEGVRLFYLSPKLELMSLTRNHDADNGVWVPGQVKRAACGVAQGHHDLKPAINCSCGIWSCKSRRFLHQAFPGALMGLNPPKVSVNLGTGKSTIVGPKINLLNVMAAATAPFYWDSRQNNPVGLTARTEIWGVVIEHEGGYRSEFARVIPESIQWFPRTTGRHRKRLLQHVRDKYANAEL